MQPDATVFLIDDDAAAAASVAALLGSVGLTVSCFGTAREFLDAYVPGVAQCLVLEVRLRGISGLQLQERLVQQGHVLPTIFLTEQGDSRLAVQAMKQGATDYLEKPFRPQHLLDAVQHALERCTELVRLRAREALLQQKMGRLTRREHEVLDLLLDGHPSKTIASRFGLSKKTIDLHRANIMQKLDASSLPELVRIAILAGAKDD